jgi:hypothetical protein
LLVEPAILSDFKLIHFQYSALKYAMSHMDVVMVAREVLLADKVSTPRTFYNLILFIQYEKYMDLRQGRGRGLRRRVLSNDEVRNLSNWVQILKAKPIHSQVELWWRLKGMVDEGLLGALLMKEEVRLENASWVSSQLAFAQKQEAMEVVELEEKGKLQDTGVREGFVEESEVEMKGNQLGKWWDEEEFDMEGVVGEKKIIRKRKWAE